MITAKQLRAGNIIVFQGELFRVLAAKHHAPGKGQAVVQAKLRNVITGIQVENRFRSTESVERAILDKRGVEFLYQDGELYHFMDSETYEQFHLSADALGDAPRYLTPNLKLMIESHEDKPVGVELPQTVQLKVTETAPFIKTATVTTSYKAAKVETGATFQVPGFVVDGDSIEVDTETGEYVGRTK